MTKAEFQAFAVSGGFDQVVIRCDAEGDFELWGHVDGFRGDELFRTARKDPKVWDSLSTVYREVRAMGYRGPITVEG